MAVKLALLAFSLVSLVVSDLQVGEVRAAAHPPASWQAGAVTGAASTAAHVFWNGALWLTGLAAISTLGRSDARRTGGVRVPVGYARGGRARLASERGL